MAKFRSIKKSVALARVADTRENSNPFFGAFDRLTVGKAIEITLGADDTMKRIKHQVTRAANAAKVSVEYFETDEGTLVVSRAA